jgi:hypothetical protein
MAPRYYQNTGFPSLTPMYGLGSYGRTAAAALISGSRTTIGNQGRIYNWYSARGKGEQYKAYLLRSLGRMPVAKNPWNLIQ